MRSEFALAVGKRLKSMRLDQGLTGHDVARELEISQGAYWNYENGYRELPTVIATRFCQLYNTDLTWLATGNRTVRTKELASLLEMILTELSEQCQARGMTLTPEVAGRIGGIVAANCYDGGHATIKQIDALLGIVGACRDAASAP